MTMKTITLWILLQLVKFALVVLSAPLLLGISLITWAMEPIEMQLSGIFKKKGVESSEQPKE